MIASVISRDVRIIWCNSLGDSYFQTYVMNNVESVFILYIYMSPCEYFMHLLVAHTTSKTLLNLVHVIVCYVLWPSKIKLLNVFNAFWGVRKLIKLNCFLKILILKIIWSHNHSWHIIITWFSNDSIEKIF